MFQDADEVRQDAFIISLLSFTPVLRRRPRTDSEKKRGYTTTYAIPTSNSHDKVTVCLAALQSILCVGAKRVRNLVAHAAKEKDFRPERRGGARYNAEHEKNKELIRRHIRGFRCKDSHYARVKAPHSQYLSSLLNVARMHSLFLEEHRGVGVSYAKYYHVLVSEFNLAFGQPRCDVCSTCARFWEKM